MTKCFKRVYVSLHAIYKFNAGVVTDQYKREPYTFMFYGLMYLMIIVLLFVGVRH